MAAVVTTAVTTAAAHYILSLGLNLSCHPATATGTRQHTAARGTVEPMAGLGLRPIGGLVGPGRTPRIVDATSLSLPRRGGTREPIGGLVGPGRTPRVVDTTSLALSRRGGTHDPTGIARTKPLTPSLPRW